MRRGAFLGALAAAPLIPVPVPIVTAPPLTPELQLAAVAPLSGPYKALGLQLAAGVRAACENQNATRLANEPAFLPNIYDDQNLTTQAVVQASFAGGNGTIVATIGHLASGPTLAALQTYANAQMPLIVPTVTDDRVTAQGYRNVFRLPARDSDEGALLGAFAVKSGARSLHVVAVKGTPGMAAADGFVRRAAALRMAAARTDVEIATIDDDAVAKTIVASGADSIALAGTVADLGPLLDAIHDAGYHGKLLATQGFFDPATLADHAAAANGLIISTNVPYYPLAPSASFDVREYEAHYGALSPVAAFGYAGVQLVRDAIRNSGLTTMPTRLSILRALQGGGTFDTIAGTFTFTQTGDAVDPNVYFYAVRDGTFAYERQAHPGGFMLK